MRRSSFLSGCLGAEPLGGLVHEVAPAPGHVAAAGGFAVALAAEMRGGLPPGRPIVWVRQDAAACEAGEVYGPGLLAFGIDPSGLLVIRCRTHTDALRAALESVRCASVGVVLVETAASADLTGSRRLKLAAEKSRVAVVLVSHAAVSQPSAARMRWRVAGAPARAGPEAGPARPTFDVTLIKHAAGRPERRWLVEWDHERGQFTQALPSALDAVPDVGSLAA